MALTKLRRKVWLRVFEGLISVSDTHLIVEPYSPIFNAIEGIFSVVKRQYYKCFSIEQSFNVLTQLHIDSFYNYSMNARQRF